MTETVSLIVLCTAFVLLVLATWQTRRKREPGKLPIIPWVGVQYVAVVVIIIVGIHLIGLWTGQDLKGRKG
jgi:hypothetical protein